MAQLLLPRLLVVGFFLLFTNQANQAASLDPFNKFSRRPVSERATEKKNNDLTQPIPVPDAGNQDGHHEHEEGHYTRFHFDRVPRRRKYSILLFGLLYLFLCCIHTGIILYQSYHLIHSVQVTSEKLVELRTGNYTHGYN